MKPDPRTPIKRAESGYTYGITFDMVVFICPSEGCGVPYAISSAWRDALYESGEGYYCPNGHYLSWHESEADKQRKRAEQAEAAAEKQRRWKEQARSERDAFERSARALKGHLTRMRNRIANGVCPVPGCKRSGFSNVRSHIAQKHPGWHAEHIDV